MRQRQRDWWGEREEEEEEEEADDDEEEKGTGKRKQENGDCQAWKVKSRESSGERQRE